MSSPTTNVNELDIDGLISTENITVQRTQSYSVNDGDDDSSSQSEEKEDEEGVPEDNETNFPAVQEELEKLMKMFCNSQGDTTDGGSENSEMLQQLFQNLFSPPGSTSTDKVGFEFHFETPEVACLYETSLTENAGIDLFMPENIEVPARSFGTIIDLKVTAVLRQNSTQAGSPASAFWLLPRSSTGLKTPLRLSNSMGLIDAGYRNTLKAIVDNVSDTPYFIERGSRLFQICSGTLEPLTWKKVEKVEDTNSYTRGLDGLGDSGN